MTYQVLHENDDETTIVSKDDNDSNDIVFGVGLPWQVRVYLARIVADILNAMETGEQVQLPVHMLEMTYFNKGQEVDKASVVEIGHTYGSKYDSGNYDVMTVGWKPPKMV